MGEPLEGLAGCMVRMVFVSVYCARCSRDADLGAGGNSPQAAREWGWRKKRGEGWVCPECVAAERRKA